MSIMRAIYETKINTIRSDIKHLSRIIENLNDKSETMPIIRVLFSNDYYIEWIANSHTINHFQYSKSVNCSSFANCNKDRVYIDELLDHLPSLMKDLQKNGYIF